MPAKSSPSITNKAVAVVLCAGQGSRMNMSGNKIFLPIAGKPLLAHTLAAFQDADSVSGILLVAQEGEIAHVQTDIVNAFGATKVIGIVPGGATRHQSEECALAALRSRIEQEEIDVVLIHDGARPFVTVDEIEALIQSARSTGGAVLATPVSDDIIVRLDAEGRMCAVLDPETLWRAQTPQAFNAAQLLEAYDQAYADGFDGTDTSSTWERAGRAVHTVKGQHTNMKITTPHDLVRAERYVRDALSRRDT